MKRVLVIVIKVVSIIIITIIGIAAALLVTLYVINEKHLINEPAKKFLNHYIVADMDFDNLYLDVKNFPTINITADNGLLISHLYKYPTDTLATFDKLEVVMEVDKLWDSDSLTISIPYVKVTNGFTLVTISENRVPGWNVWRFRAPKPRREVKRIPPQRLWINEVQLCGHNKYRYYNDYRKRIMNIEADSVYVLGSVQIIANNIYFDSIYVQNAVADITLMNGKTTIKGKTPQLTLSSTIDDSLRYYTIHTQLSDSEFIYDNNEIFNYGDSVGINGTLGFNPFTGRYASKETNITVNKTTTLDITGKYNSKNDSADIDLAIATPSIMDMAKEFKLDTLSILKRIIPKNMGLKAQLKTSGEVNVNDVTTVPLLDVTAEVFGGSLWIKDVGYLDNFNSNIAAIIDINNQSFDTLDIKNLGFKYKSSKLKANGVIYMDNLNKPIADVNLKTTINIADINHYIPEDLHLEGVASVDASIVSPLYKGADKSLVQIVFNDSIKLSDFRFLIPNTNAELVCEYGNIFMASSKKLNYPDLIKIRLDNIWLNSYHDMNISARELDVTLDITPSTTRYMPKLLKGDLSLHNSTYDFYTLDSISIDKLVTSFDIDINSLDAPIVDYIATVSDVKYTNSDSLLILLDRLGINANATLYKTADFSKGIKYKLWDVIGDWRYGGAVHIDNARGIMQQLPLISVINQADIEFDQNDFTLNELNLSIGDSHGNLYGDVNNWRKYVFEDSLLTVRAHLDTEHVMLNELIPAIVDGGIYSQNSKSGKENSHTGFLEVPNNLDVVFTTSIINTNYEKIVADSASFIVQIKDKGFYVDSLSLTTDFLRLGLSFSYLTSDIDSAYTSTQFDIDKFNAARLIDEVPTISQAIPLLASFEGDFETTLNATWIIDENMNIVEPSVTSIAKLTGENLSIERSAVMPNWLGWLLLGKDKDISIDTLDLDLTINNELLMLHPTTINVNDKYLIDTHGVTSTDAYRYHLLLKENPLWFQIAFNLFNKGEKLKLKLASLKSESLEEMAEMLDTTDTSNTIYDPTTVHNFDIKNERNQLNNNYNSNYNKLLDTAANQ